MGLEWSHQGATGWRGRPFAAIDLDVRGDEDYTPNLTIQAGWEWRQPAGRVSSLRLGLEYYNGRSPYGQFFELHEQWIGAGIWLDF